MNRSAREESVLVIIYPVIQENLDISRSSSFDKWKDQIALFILIQRKTVYRSIDEFKATCIKQHKRDGLENDLLKGQTW